MPKERIKATQANIENGALARAAHAKVRKWIERGKFKDLSYRKKVGLAMKKLTGKA